MSNTILILGEPGTGKSSSVRNLDPAETVLINVNDQSLPFRGSRKMYNAEAKNYKTSDHHLKINKWLRYVSEEMEHIKTIVIDDAQYIMANEYMRRSSETGWIKYSEIAYNFWTILKCASDLRDGLNIYFLSHSEEDERGFFKAKTIGKVLNDKIRIEGMFPMILHSIVQDGQYRFYTNIETCYLGKSPMGMFEDKLIDNDLVLVNSKIEEYFCEEGE